MEPLQVEADENNQVLRDHPAVPPHLFILVSQPKAGHRAGGTEHENKPVLTVLTNPNCLIESRNSNAHYEVRSCTAALTLEGA